MNKLNTLLLVSFFFFTLLANGKEGEKKITPKNEVGSLKTFENFIEAQKAYEGGAIPLSEGLSFIVVSTKIGLFSSQVLGLVKTYETKANFKKDKLEDMSIVFPIKSMDTDNESRDKKLHELCLGSPDFNVIEVKVKGPLTISATESGEEQEIDATILIRGKEKNIKLKMKLYKTTLNNESWLRSEGGVVLSVKELEIPDPSIAIAKLSDQIEVKFKVNIPLTK